jgi:uncharacterized membrane protein YeaQ/YmgE (transglycosylase-associated protein family)
VISTVVLLYGIVKLLIDCFYFGFPFFAALRFMPRFDLACLIIGSISFVPTVKHLIHGLISLRVSEMTSNASLRGPVTILALSVIGAIVGFLLRPTFLGQTLPLNLSEETVRNYIFAGAIIGAAVGFCIWRLFPQPSVSRPPIPDTLASLEHLADLHQRGILSDAEFQNEKGKLLASRRP